MLRSSKKRDSNLELLRILGMFLIILYHSARHADYGKMLAEPFGLNTLVNVILTSWGQVGNIVFVLISSWFLIEQEGICFKKVMNIFLQAWSYSVLILVFVILGRLRPIGLKEMIKALITPFYGGYWFITTYLAFYMLVPALRYLTQKVTVDTLKRLCLLLTILIPAYNVFFENPGATLADFCYTFFLAAYLKKKKNNWFEQHSCGGVLQEYY